MIEAYRALRDENERLKKTVADQEEHIQAILLELERTNQGWAADVAVMLAMKKEGETGGAKHG